MAFIGLYHPFPGRDGFGPCDSSVPGYAHPWDASLERSLATRLLAQARMVGLKWKSPKRRKGARKSSFRGRELTLAAAMQPATIKST